MNNDFYRIKRLPPYIFEEVNRIKARLRAEGTDIIDFGMGNPDMPTPKHIVDKLIETARDPKAGRYSASKGIVGLRKAMAGYYDRRFGVKLDYNTEVIATLGSKEGFANLAQALTAPGGGSTSAKLAEWARDHYLGPVVTFGEWISYNPPKAGGTPGFSLDAPGGTTPARDYKKTHGFVPNIPQKLTSPAGKPLPGEGAWRVLETVKGYPAIFGTFLRPSAVYTSYVAGLVSMDQRLVRFGLRPGAEDPGPGHWKASTWIPPGTRKGLLATFNGGFKLDSAGGGFYLNGSHKGALVNGAASVVYYRDGTIKIGSWGRELRMTPNVVGVRQNLKLLVDHGKVPATVNQNVTTNWGATLGGGYYVWRSALGITRGGRVIFVYGPALDVKELAGLLRRAGAVEALQLDINPEWMSYDYYKAGSHPSSPTPHALLPTQQGSVYRYYQVYSRDFTVVYSR